MEQPEWKPPVLTFLIERHGATRIGSSRAERHKWTINVETKEAHCAAAGYRQVFKRDQPFHADEEVEEVVDLILKGSDDPGLKWSADRSTVRVLIGEWVDANNARTKQGRSHRFRKALKDGLARVGW